MSDPGRSVLYILSRSGDHLNTCPYATATNQSTIIELRTIMLRSRRAASLISSLCITGTGDVLVLWAICPPIFIEVARAEVL
jgi:hypothetical protein